MAEAGDHLGATSRVVQGLRQLGLEPVLVGGMALVVLGSRRVTRDFDFVVPVPRDRLTALVGVFYDRGLELVSRLRPDGEVAATIESRRVAAIRLRADKPASAYFFHPRTRLRIDLLFDFPLPAADLLAQATPITIRGHRLLVASEGHLLQLKRIAAAARSVPGDADDIAFLQSRTL